MKSDIIRKVFFLFFIIFLMCILSYKILEPIQAARFKLYIKPRNPDHVDWIYDEEVKSVDPTACWKNNKKGAIVVKGCECTAGINIKNGKYRCDNGDWVRKLTFKSSKTSKPFESNKKAVLNSIIFKNENGEGVHAWHLNRHNLFSNADEKILDVSVPFNTINNNGRNIASIDFKVLNGDAHYERILIHPEGRQDNYNGYYGNTMQNRDNNVILYDGVIQNGKTQGGNLRNDHKIQTYEYAQSSVGASDNITSQT